MELTVVLAGVPVRLSLRSPAYAACFQPFRTEADPVAAVRVPEDALKEAEPHYEAGTTPEQVEYLELGPRVCDALLPYGSLDTAPLGGIILLEQSEENRMRRLLPAEAAGPLLTQLLFTRKNTDDVRAACALEERLLAQVPVWLLQNRGDAASAALCRDTLMEAQT